MSSIKGNIAITGIGVVSPLGNSYSELSRRYTNSEVAFQQLTELSTQDELPLVGAPVKSLSRPGGYPLHLFKRLDLASQYAVSAFSQAWTDEHESYFSKDRVGVIFSTGIGGLSTITTQVQSLNIHGARRVSPHTVPAAMHSAPAANLSLLSQSHGWVESPSSACSGGAQSILRSLELLEANQIDVAICGASEAILNRFGIAAFSAMNVIPRTQGLPPDQICKPLDKSSRGFLLGDSSVVLILERKSTAFARDAHIFGTIRSASATFDCHDLVSPSPNGIYAAQAMNLALNAAGLQPSDIDLVKAHATGTQAGDCAEATAIHTVFRDSSTVSFPAICAPKALLGHCISASGPLELICALVSLNKRIVPAHPYMSDPIPELLFSPQKASAPLAIRSEANGLALLNTFGFGGTNISIVLESA